jgi:hypothetical protein
VHECVCVCVCVCVYVCECVHVYITLLQGNNQESNNLNSDCAINFLVDLHQIAFLSMSHLINNYNEKSTTFLL